MQIALMLLISIHALIHGLGFLKAFRLLPLPQLPLNLSETTGILWLLAALALLISGVLMLASWNLWWALAVIALLVSQTLIVQTWSFAKFGTIPNLIIFISALLSFGSWNFERAWDQLRLDTLQGLSQNSQVALVTEDSWRELPAPLQNWLRWSQAGGRPKILAVSMKQKGAMRLKPDQSEWMPTESEQLISTAQNAFIWKVHTRMLGLPVMGRDSFLEGKGSMWIGLFGLIPVVNVANHPKINQSALQRFLGEILWVPTAALHPSIVWTARDDTSVAATMNWAGTQGSAIFYFHPNGEPSRFVAQRFKDVKDEAPLEWVAEILAFREFEGRRIPSRVKASWVLPSGAFTWYEFEVVDARFSTE